MSDKMPAVILDTLETVIGPGKRARLSPFVETAQLTVLTGERPDDRRRAESAQAILKRNNQRIEEIARYWAEFARQGKYFAESDYAHRDFLDAYLAYYFSVNVSKVQLVLLDLVRNELLVDGTINLLDIGVGTGTTGVAGLDFFLVWGQVCGLYGQSFPVKELRLVGVDRSEGCISYAKRVVSAYTDALWRRLESQCGAEGMQVKEVRSPRSDILHHVHSWASAATWHQLDLEMGVPSPDFEPNLVIMANVWNELGSQGKENFETFLRTLPQGAIAIVIEPGNEIAASSLMAWRRRFVEQNPEFISLAPCGQEYGNRLPASCTDCWNFRRESFHQPPLYRAFREACNKLLPDKRSFDDYENRLLSWSYVVLGKQSLERVWKGGMPRELHDGEAIQGPIRLRYIGSYRSKEGDTDPVSYAPDDFRAREDEGSWKEYLKVCPAHYDALKIAIERQPGFQIPPLRYGQQFVVSSIRVKRVREQRAYVFMPQEGGQTEIEALDWIRSDPRLGFLPQYEDKARQAIDELAYRLFGFPRMWDLQHEILSRVLTGQPILGIAATGGGKSECFILPAMLLPGITVVVAPLKSLMADQYEQRIKRRFGLRHLTTYINGDVPFHERQARLKRMELGYYKLVYFTPEQLERGYVLDSLRRAHQAVGIRYLAMDEAHCISQWGHDFRPSYLNILRRLQEKGRGISPLIIALTATASPRVREDVCEELGLNSAMIENGGDVFVHSSNRPELNLVVRVMRTTEEKSRDILEELKKLEDYNKHNQDPGAALVFLPHTGGSPEDVWRYYPEGTPQHSRRGMLSAGVTPFASFLERRLGRRLSIYHGKMEVESDNPEDRDTQGCEEINRAVDEKPLGDLSGRSRESEQSAFIEGQRDIMVATKGFGMGIDKPNIRLVIHRTPTANLEAYAQEAGRAGRDGELATAILCYSPDRPIEIDDRDSSRSIQSDHEIQAFFIKERYVRRVDVIVMRAFLQTVHRILRVPRKDGRGVNRYLHFTNDEAMAFFDRCAQQSSLAGLETVYSWPSFAPREPKGTEWDEHKAILDRGHVYECKTKYIDRILAVLYRIRPGVEGMGRRLAFLESVQKTGARVREPQIVNWDGIRNSNAYFGKILREKGVSHEEFERALRGSDLLSFAQRLEMPVKELTAMLNDIKNCDGGFDKEGNWCSDLLEFWWVEAPKFGPAIGRDSPAAWREYAGARTRASKGKADDRAKKHKRRRRSLDDWFYWNELNRSVGWEVMPGPAFEDQDFWTYLEAFIQLHDERQRNDWASYYRLLTDYVGVNADGTLDPRRSRKCLRAALLGYLKSYEVVVGDSCLSCSNCVPDEQFEQFIVEQRSKVVERISPQTAELLDRAEECAETLPPETLIANLFEAIQEEEAKGRSLIRYTEGWSGRLLQDTPGHRAGFWIRLKAMAEGLIELQPQEFVDNAERLARLASDAEASAVWQLLARAHEVVPDEPEIYAVQVDLCSRLGLFREEEKAWRGVIKLSDKQDGGKVDDVLLVKAYTRLHDLYAPDGPLADQDRHADCLLHLGCLSRDASTALGYYAQVVRSWNWEEVVEELERCASEKRHVAPAGLLCAWASTGDGSRSQQRAEQAATYLATSGWHLVEQAGQAEARLLVSRLGVHTLATQPGIVDRFAALLLAGEKADVKELQPGLELCLAALAAGEALTADTVDTVVRVLFRDSRQTASAAQLLCPYFNNEPQMEQIVAALAHRFRPTTVDELHRWFALFPTRVHLAAPPEVALCVLRAAEGVAWQVEKQSPVSGSVLDSLQQIVTCLVGYDDYRQQAHESWIRICEYLPDRLAEHAKKCLAEQPALREWATEQLLHFARISRYASAALDCYTHVVHDWSWEQVVEELERCASEKRYIAPVGLLCAWASTSDGSRSQQRAEQAVTYMTTSGWHLVEQASRAEARLLLSRLGVHTFATQPGIVDRFAELLLAGEETDAKDLQPGLELCLVALAAGNKLAPDTLNAVNRVLFKDPRHSGSVIQSLYPDVKNELQIKRILAALMHNFQPATIDELQRWLAVFPARLHLAASSEVASRILCSAAEGLVWRAEKQSSPVNSALDSLQEIASHLLGCDGYTQQAHESWLRICRYLPERLAEYTEMCLEAQSPHLEYAEEAFGRLLDTGDPEYIRVYLKSLRPDAQPNLQGAKRIARTAEFFWLMLDHVKTHGSGFLRNPRAEDFSALQSVFDPQHSVERADMLVAAIRVLRELLNPNWLTPIAWEAEALCYARRYDEAAELAKQCPDLEIGRRREPLGARLKREWDRLGTERAADSQDRDYQRIMRACFVNSYESQ